MTRYLCCDERRLLAVRRAGVLNGIDFVEVPDAAAPTEALRQRTLFVRLLLAPAALTAANVTLTGGTRIPEIALEWVATADALPAGEDPALIAGVTDPATLLVVRTASRGDFSSYRLRLVAGVGDDAPPAGFDPRLVEVELSLKIDCPSDFDCDDDATCPPPASTAPEIDYLAKDFGSFRRLMLDRISLLAPDWTERNVADLGVTLVEALAYVADELSYRQDAVATEAYLGTARRRTSLRRHARLVDYAVSEGCNARVWVRVDVEDEVVVVDRGTAFLTRVPAVPARVEPGDADHSAALAAGAETFEVVERAVVHGAHRSFDLWTWGDAGCCLPAGATSATLVGDHPALRAGDVLVLAEVASPTTGRPEDADPARRAAVRLTSVIAGVDPSGGLFADTPTNDPLAVTEITWDAADALPFSLCVSVEERPGLRTSVVWGNVVLADHGRTVRDESLGAAPEPVLTRADVARAGSCDQPRQRPIPVRFRPTLAATPLTHARPGPSRILGAAPDPAGLVTDLQAGLFSDLVRDELAVHRVHFAAGEPVVRGAEPRWSVSDGITVAVIDLVAGGLVISGRPDAAAATLTGDPRSARPQIQLTSVDPSGATTWRPSVDLLASGPDAAAIVVEVEHDGTSTVRFGDGAHGRRPAPGSSFTADYRVGNGAAGNVGADAVAHVASIDGRLLGVTNPLPAAGGMEPEAADAIRRDAPEAFLVQERAVTADDYARVAERQPGVQRAAGTIRWTGSWHTVFVTADRLGGTSVDAAFESALRRGIEPSRMAGYDLEVDGPRLVPLEMELFVCVLPDHFRADVRAAVLDVLSSGVRRDGALGYFHPDRFTFGQPVHLSPIVAAAQAVPGVASVEVPRFRRQRDPASSGLAAGVLPMGRLEIARLDNDPSFPERGSLRVETGGGK